MGVNQRDLTTFEVDSQRAVQVARSLPADVITVAESGISGRRDLPPLRDAGYDAILVGEALVTSADPEAAVRDLIATE